MLLNFVTYFICFLAGLVHSTKNHNLQIIGGRNTTISKHPYQVSLTILSKFTCSGVVLNHQWVLTTGSCISGVRYFPYDIKIRVSSNDYSAGGLEYDCDSVFMNEHFTYLSQDYDVAVLKIKGKFKFGKTLKPIKLATKSLTVGEKGLISGWGSSNESFYTHNIKELDVKVIKIKDCAKIYKTYTLTNRMFCAGSEDYGACWNDLSDPLVVKNKLYGLLSFNNGCFDTYYPSVYTNIPNLRDWIYTTIKNSTNHLA